VPGPLVATPAPTPADGRARPKTTHSPVAHAHPPAAGRTRLNTPPAAPDASPTPIASPPPRPPLAVRPTPASPAPAPSVHSPPRPR